MSTSGILELVACKGVLYTRGQLIGRYHLDLIESGIGYIDGKIENNAEEFVADAEREVDAPIPLSVEDFADDFVVDKDMLIMSFQPFGTTFDAEHSAAIGHDIEAAGAFDVLSESTLLLIGAELLKRLTEHNAKIYRADKKVTAVNLIAAFVYWASHYNSPEGEDWDSGEDFAGFVELEVINFGMPEQVESIWLRKVNEQ